MDLNQELREDWGFMSPILIKKAVDAQAEDPSLWFVARTITEQYLQQALRNLHRVIESGDLEALDNIIECMQTSAPCLCGEINARNCPVHQ